MKVSGWLLFLFGCITALTTITGVTLNYSPVPFWDQWFGTVDWYMRAERDWWPAFWSLHNEHRLLFSRLIFWPDMYWFGGVNVLSLTANVVVCALLALSVYRAAVFRAAVPMVAKLAIAGISMAFCFSWMQSDNFTWGFQSQWFAVNLFALLAFHALAVSASKDHSSRWFALSLSAATVSTFSMANGAFAWPLLILLALYLRFPWRFVLIALVVAVGEGLAYFLHAKGATGSIPHGTFKYVIQHQPGDLAHYAVLYLGSPMWYVFHGFGLAAAAGILVVIGTAAGFVVAIKRRDFKAVSLLAFAGFLCITALATGVGRLVLGLANVFQPRYATNALLAWMAILLFWSLNHSSRVVRRPLYLGFAVSLIAIAICQRAALGPDQDVIYNRLVAGQAIREHVYDHQYLGILWDHDDYLKTIIDAARKQQVSILAANAAGYDNPPARIETSERCAGSIDRSIATDTPGYMRAEGWVFVRDDEPKTVAITDVDGNTVGGGVVGNNRPDAAAAMKTNNTRIGWVAFYKATSPVHAIARTGDGYCKIN